MKYISVIFLLIPLISNSQSRNFTAGYKYIATPGGHNTGLIGIGYEKQRPKLLLGVHVYTQISSPDNYVNTADLDEPGEVLFGYDYLNHFIIEGVAGHSLKTTKKFQFLGMLNYGMSVIKEYTESYLVIAYDPATGYLFDKVETTGMVGNFYVSPGLAISYRISDKWTFRTMFSVPIDSRSTLNTNMKFPMVDLKILWTTEKKQTGS